MSNELKYYKKNIPHRWYRAGERVIQVTPKYMSGDTRVFHYEYIEKMERRGCFIVGFRLFDDMMRISEKEWLSELLSCSNKK
jgi:hypothetical protein